MTIDDAIKTLVKSKNSEGYLVDSNKKLVGKFDLPYLLSQKNKKKKINKVSVEKFLKLSSDENVFKCIDICKDFVGESIPVVEKKGTLSGVVTEGDLFQIFLKVSKEEKEMENED